jgi:ArsR family transcriptional regulator, arsenate/arsenite/antimonite-responsive transcriptional repressor
MAQAKRKTTLDDNQVQLIARALSDPRRYEILKRLGECTKPLACADVRRCADISPATLSHHMRELEIAGLVEPQRKGKFVNYHLRRDMLAAFLARLRDDLAGS